MRIRLTFNNQSMIATLYDNPSARDLMSLLPLDLTIDNYGNNEKIAYLPRKLTEEGSGPFGNEAPGDLCYFAPWGNLALFYAGYRWSEGVIRLGRFEGSFEPCSRGENSRSGSNAFPEQTLAAHLTWVWALSGAVLPLVDFSEVDRMSAQERNSRRS